MVSFKTQEINMKTFTIKKYKGNLLESCEKFLAKNPGMKILEAKEENDELKIKADDEQQVNETHKMSRQELDDFIKKLETGVVHFEYKKKDGSMRVAIGTANPQLIPSEAVKKFQNDPNYRRNIELMVKQKDYFVVYFDMQKMDFRKFHVGRFEKIHNFISVNGQTVSEGEESDETCPDCGKKECECDK